MEDFSSGLVWGVPSIMLHATRSSSGSIGSPRLGKGDSEVMRYKLLPSALPPLSGHTILPDSSSSCSSVSCSCSSRGVEGSCRSFGSSVSVERPYGTSSARLRFLPEPLHAAAAPASSPADRSVSCGFEEAAGRGVVGSSETHNAQAAASSPASSSETDTEAEAVDNPLLPRRSRKNGGPSRGSDFSCRFISTSSDVTRRGSSAASGGSREDSSSHADAGRRGSSVQKSGGGQEPLPSCGSEAASTAGDVPLSASAREVTSGGAEERLDELSLLSFNAGLLEYKLCGVRVYQNPPFTQRRLHHIPSALLATGADIICLQEVYGEAHADFIIESTRHKLPFVGRRTSGGRFSLHNGLMVLSKFPIVHTHFHKFEDVTYIERCFASKGMLEVAIDVPSIGVIAVFNMHLASGAVDPESRYVEDVRAAEIRQLLKACDAAADRGLIPLVIAPHLCASNYKCFVERGWRDCWLHVHGHQRHLLQHHLLHQQQLLDEQQLDDQGIELHDRHIRRDLFVRVRRQRRMQMNNAQTAANAEQLPPEEAAAAAADQQQQQGELRAASPFGSAAEAGFRDRDKEQKQQLLEGRGRAAARGAAGFPSSEAELERQSRLSGQQRGSRPRASSGLKYSRAAAASDSGEEEKAQSSPVFPGSVELARSLPASSSSASGSGGASAILLKSSSAAGGPPAAESLPDAASPVTNLLGGYFGRAGGGMQLPFAFELPAAAAWAHREFFLTAKRRLIEQQQKWLGGADKAPVLDVRLSLTGPCQERQRGVDSTPLASDWSLASCSTALTAGRCGGDTALLPAAAWQRGAGGSLSTAAQQQQQHQQQQRQPFWQEEGPDGSVADWLLSDTDEEMEASAGRDVIIECQPDGRGAAAASAAACSRRDFTWDPENPLNSIGPHAGCHGLRCDYVFLPPHNFAGGLYPFLPVTADILLRDPRVLVDACCFGCFGQVMLVTLSDHYAIRITLRRSTDADIADFWGSCAAEAAALRPPAGPLRPEAESQTQASEAADNSLHAAAPWLGLSAS
ncbi:hypothetical protein Efla_004239 [Eimeria flavescens]